MTANIRPPTIHDFGGFPQALYKVDYPAPGDPSLAEGVRAILGNDRVQLSDDWGLDHGIWSVLCWMYPQADVPVVQLSIDRRLDVRRHYAIGRSLLQLRSSRTLVIASGNVVHNLHDAFQQTRSGTSVTPDWASRFDEAVKQALLQRDIETLLSLWPENADAQRAHPTPDHWLPLIYAAGATDESDHINFPNEGFDLGTISMRNVIFG